jgi:cytochrome c oxidase assembly factor CtaG
MDEVFEIFELGELFEGGLQLLVAGVLLVLGVVLMLAELLIDGLFLWGALLFVLGIVAAVFAAASFLDIFF